MLNLIDITTADGTHIKFKDTGSDSSYLFVTGDNGCGKSTILKNVLTNFVNIHPKKTDPKFKLTSTGTPSKIITYSLTPFNKLDINRRYFPNEDIELEQIGTTNNGKYSLIFQAACEFAKKRGEENSRIIEHIKKETKLSPNFIIRAQVSRSSNDILLSRFQKQNLQDFYNLILETPGSLEIEISPGHFNLIIGEKPITGLPIEEMIRGILLLRSSGRMRIVKINGIQNNRDIDVADLSSGQIALFVGLTILSSSMKNNSLILIDEPEISLHPAWQTLFTKLIFEIGKHFKNCFFIIATHSPLVISGAVKKYSNTVNLTNKFDFPESYDSEGIERIFIDHFDTITKNNFIVKDLIIKAAHSIITNSKNNEYESALKQLHALTTREIDKKLISSILEKTKK
ncbi:AAA family ATPase [Pseudomonas sp. Sample_16]|uniref:AAA family ATPase n=1 Tax=Pseudomonas sp. Sample_16 TaxID=2448263 RepID=UPI0015AE5F90|nr:AAA family ATPase [Pseudomonas sp. Sample_16]